MTEPTSNPSQNRLEAASLLNEPSAGAETQLQVNIAPAAARRLSEENLQRLAAAREQEANLPGWQSLGKGGKPSHAHGRQGRRERKVRW
ncbi:hypothetical protein ITX31_09105 [Arthrobacter gandavensis]|uniref:hypothetical protein n=1 Tax=Arthrobacter gandavensis TaxID=169960 RepID=UPI00188F605D|nr:hypothetical protein [Arthrobacter gandavensis]MBF4994268.1 hypothetical protein [Arthrobacter gandavensis]